MIVNYPECLEEEEKCRFVSDGCSQTLMDSPIIYDREGNAVGGGGNIITSYLMCMVCNRMWTSKQTALEKVQGKPIEWL